MSIGRTVPVGAYLGRLASAVRRTRGRVPYVQQLTSSDCGAACLTMVLRAHGSHVSLATVRAAVGEGRGGVSAYALARAAETCGLQARAVRVAPEHIDILPRPAILHWERHHFVVLENVSRDRVDIVDPAIGRSRTTSSDFCAAFTGVAILFTKTHRFRVAPRQPGVLAPIARLLCAAPQVGALVVLSVLLIGLALATPAVMKIIADEVASGATDSGELANLLGLGTAAVVVAYWGGAHLRGRLLWRMRLAIDRQLTTGLIDKVLRLPLAFLHQRYTDDIVARIRSSGEVRDILTVAVVAAVIDAAFVTVCLAALTWVFWQMAAIALVLGAVQMGVLIFTAARQRARAAAMRRAQAEAEDYQIRMVEEMEVVKVMALDRAVRERAERLCARVRSRFERYASAGAAIEALMAATRFAAPLVILVFGFHLIVAGKAALGVVLAALFLASSFLGALGTLVRAGVSFPVLASHLERIADIDGAAVAAVAGSGRPSSPGCGIEVQDIHFRYEGATSDVIKGLSLQIPPGRMTAVVGATGAGKSTLLRLLVGMYHPTHGVVRYGGVDLRDLDLVALRHRVGFAASAPQLLGTTIQEAITLGAAVSKGQLIAAARSACIHEDIEALPRGYDTPLADGLAILSSGQLQRVAIARAIVRRPDIVLLDEATSALDPLTEARIYSHLLTTGATRIVISHRRSAVERADVVVVLEGGRVAEIGPPAELVTAGGKYFELFGPIIESESEERVRSNA